MRSIALSILVLLSTTTASAECGAGLFTPLRSGDIQNTYWLPTPRVHDTLWLVDPANQQYAAFDLEFGGILASLRYDPTGHVLNGSRELNPAATELIWGHHPGGMLQPAWSRGRDEFSYFPNPAGDVEGHGRGPAVLGAVCKDAYTLTIYSGVPDFYPNIGLIGRAGAVKNENIVLGPSGAQDMWITPYTLTTTVTFVPNPGGAPAYYLKVDMFIMNIDTRERVGFGGGFSLYAPGTTDPCVDGEDGPYSCVFHPESGPGSFKYQIADPAQCVGDHPSDQCVNNTKLVIGKYPNAAHTAGVATSMAASLHFPNGTVTATPGGFDQYWNNSGGGSAVFPFKIPSLGGLHFTVFVLAGDWAAADAFNPY